MSSLLRKFLALKKHYRSYDTRCTVIKMQAFRNAVYDLSFNGRPAALEILGSIDFGISDESSDTDCVLLYYCTQDHPEVECPLHCETLQFYLTSLKSKLEESIASEMNSNIELLDWINLAHIEKFVLTRDDIYTDLAYRFLYYRTVARPVNLPLIVQYSDVLEKDREFRESCNRWASDMLRIYLDTETHWYSFSKYNERIAHSGLRLPEDLKKKLKSYLD